MDTAINFNEMDFNSFEKTMNDAKAIVEHALKIFNDADDTMEYIHSKVSEMKNVTPISRRDEALVYDTPFGSMTIVNNLKVFGSVNIVPNMKLKVSIPTTGAIRYENEDFILFRIDCQRAYECDWSTLFRDDLNGIAALNIDNFKYELGASCWWDNNNNFSTYVLISKEAINDMEKYLDEDREEDFTHGGKVEYLLYKNHTKIGFIWNDHKATICLDGNIVFNGNGFVANDWKIVDNNYKID